MPGVVYVCVAVTPVPLTPSPKFHAYETIVPSTSVDVDASIETSSGALPVNGLLLAAQRHHLVPAVLDQRNSGDTAGGRDRVVGYTSIAFSTERPHVAH